MPAPRTGPRLARVAVADVVSEVELTLRADHQEDDERDHQHDDGGEQQRGGVDDQDLGHRDRRCHVLLLPAAVDTLPIMASR